MMLNLRPRYPDRIATRVAKEIIMRLRAGC
jgi:hypothetical protein